MDAQPNGMQTHGRKGFSYDWQSLLVPAEPEFSKQLNDIINDDTVSADLGSYLSLFSDFLAPLWVEQPLDGPFGGSARPDIGITFAVMTCKNLLLLM